jgi:uncharacterized repeat protein (TIGR01451 family)
MFTASETCDMKIKIKTTLIYKLLRNSILFMILFYAMQSHGQVIKPLGNGLPSGVEAHCFYKGDLYAIYYDSYHNNLKRYNLSKWNGVFWSTLDSFKLYAPGDSFESAKKIYALTFYNEDIYIAGLFDSIVNIPGSRYVVMWNNKKWTGLGGHRIPAKDTLRRSYITSMAVFKNHLIVAGKIDTLPGVGLKNMASWDGNKWDYVGSQLNQGVDIPGKPDSASVRSMLVYKDSLFAFGYFTRAGNLSSVNIAKWDGQLWSNNYQADFPGEILAGCFYQGSLFIFLPGHIYKTSGPGKNWTALTNAVGFQNISFATFNGKLWISGLLYDTLQLNYFAIYDGKHFSKVKSTALIAEYPETYLDSVSGKLYLTGYFNQGNTSVNTGIVKTSYSKVSGYVYQDLNGNCKYDAGDLPLQGKLIQTNPGFNYTSTDTNGYYEMYLPADNYEIRSIPGKHYSIDCPAPQKFYSIKMLTDSSYDNINFATSVIPHIKDLQISLACTSGGYRAVKGNIEKYRIDYENTGTEGISNFSIALKHDPLLTKFSATPPPDIYTNPLAVWHLTNLSPGMHRHIDFEVKIDSTLNYNDKIRFFARFDSVTCINDSDLRDNFDTLVQIVASSHDPNNKQSYPFGDITASDKNIRYMIHFQNTGTATATKVVVVDTLDLALPLTEVVINSSSHPYHLKIDNNVLIWTFDKINLPDSSSDLSKSMGYISFSTGIKQGVGTGKIIKNKAYIYFDYEQPVETNETINTIVYNSTGIETGSVYNSALRAYPNPAHNQLFIENLKTENLELTLFNAMGQSVKTIRLPASQTTAIETSNFAPGIYFLKTNSGQANTIVINH